MSMRLDIHRRFFDSLSHQRAGVGFCLMLVMLATGCGSPMKGSRWVRSEIYFGLTQPNGASISEQDWQAFLDEVVTPKFSSGLTVLSASGQWRNASGHIDREPSKVLVLLHPASPETETTIDNIRAQYCSRFKQEAVMKITTPARVTF